MRSLLVLWLVACAGSKAKVKLGAECTKGADCASAICDATNHCAAEGGGSVATLSITSVESDLPGGIVRDSLKITGDGFDDTLEATIGGLAAPVTFVSATEVRVALTAPIVAIGAASTPLRIFNVGAEASRDISLSKGARGASGQTRPPPARFTPDGVVISLDQSHATADAFTIVSEGPAVAATGRLGPALAVSNASGGVGLRVSGRIDLTEAQLRLPFYFQDLGDVSEGGLGTPSVNVFLPSLPPGEIVPGVAYCKAGDIPISGGCVSHPNSCGLTVSEPVTAPLSSGHMGWKCRSSTSTGATAGCFVTVDVICLKVH